MRPFHSPSGAFEPLAKFFRFEGDEHVLSGLNMHVEQLLEFLVERNYPLILFIQTRDPSSATVLRIGVKTG